jgi:phthalate 4,5-cis-dihydrodiol dehydrogenase
VTARVLRIGVAGLGRAFTLMLPTLRRDPRVELVAAADPVTAARAQFERDFAGRGHDSVAALCADPDVDVVYIATPHALHAEHALLAFAHGKHVLVEKPLAVTLPDCTRMIDAAAAAQRQLIVGHSHSFDGPVLRVRALLDSGEFGAVRMIHAFYATDFLYRPRRPEELRTADGGGVIYSQAVHQLDIVRLLGGGLVHSVRAQTGAWDRERPTEGAYSALLTFANGAFASATYSGYAHYDGDELADGISELGLSKSAAAYGAARERLAAAAAAGPEAALKAARNYGGNAYTVPDDHDAPAHQHFGHVVVCCDRGDLRPTPTGVAIYGDRERRFETLPAPAVPRAEVIDELWAAVVDGRPPLHDGRWARATLEVCAAMLDSARDGRDVELQYQTAPGASPR